MSITFQVLFHFPSSLFSQHLDNLLTNHHYSNTNKKPSLDTSNASNVTTNSEGNSNTTLRSKLLLQPMEFLDTLPPILFKKYIGNNYAVLI